MQEPLTVGRYAGWGQDDIVNQTVIFMSYLRGNYAGVQITSVEAYPYNSASLLNWWMRALTNACVAAGVAPPDQFEVDHDQNAPGWSWSEIPTMRDQAHALGWSFGYIFGSPVPPYQQSWAANAFQQGVGILQYGTSPDIYAFESWEPNDPLWTIPEDSSDWTFMRTVKSFRSVGYFPR